MVRCGYGICARTLFLPLPPGEWMVRCGYGICALTLFLPLPQGEGRGEGIGDSSASSILSITASSYSSNSLFQKRKTRHP